MTKHKRQIKGFPSCSVVKKSACNAGNVGSSLGSGRSTEGGNYNPLQYSCLGNSIERGAEQAAVHRVAELNTTEVIEHAHRDRFRASPLAQWKTICLQCRRPGFNPWVGKIPLGEGIVTCSSILAWRIP